MRQDQTTHLQEFSIQDEVRDHDSEKKEKGKVYADWQRNACEGEIQEGDKDRLKYSGVTETGERKQTVKSPYKQQGKWNLVSHFSTVLVYLNYIFLRIKCNNDCWNTCMCIHVITVTSDGP